MSEQQKESIKNFTEKMSELAEDFIGSKGDEFRADVLSKVGCFFLISYLFYANEDEDTSKQRLNHAAQFVWKSLIELKEMLNKEAVIE